MVTQLRLKGVDIVRCDDVGLKYSGDDVHLEYAVQHGRTIVTCDEDFFRWDSTWKQEGKSHMGIIFISSEKQGVIGVIVKELLFLHEAIAEGAASLENDVYNRVLTIR